MESQMETEERKPYVPRSDEELKQIAQDWVMNVIFTSDQVRGQVELKLVFMPLVFIEQAEAEWMQENKITLFYASMSDALPRSIDGMPVFLTMRGLNQDDHKKMIELARRIDEAINDVPCESKDG
jgi:hypothetical protein